MPSQSNIKEIVSNIFLPRFVIEIIDTKKKNEQALSDLRKAVNGNDNETGIDKVISDLLEGFDG